FRDPSLGAARRPRAFRRRAARHRPSTWLAFRPPRRRTPYRILQRRRRYLSAAITSSPARGAFSPAVPRVFLYGRDQKHVQCGLLIIVEPYLRDSSTWGDG